MTGNGFQPVIGLEVHIQLLTQSKVFSTEAFAFGEAPNSCVSVITLAHPGALPSINARCIEFAIRLGLATNCRINAFSQFARKNYFYPDLPKGYQLSQDHNPICVDGHVELPAAGGAPRRIRIERIHLEEDAGKSIHEQSPGKTLIDLNRAGTPLLELVTHPDLRTPEEVGQFLTEIRKLVRYIGVSDGDMEKGNLRCDANVSVMPAGSEVLGTRVEVKNLNSINFSARAVAFEIGRQIELIRAGGAVERETRLYDPASGRTQPMRDKESAADYRYFPEPDLLPLHISEMQVAEIRASLPEMPWQREARYMQAFGLDAAKAQALSARREWAEYFEAMCGAGCAPAVAANWLLGPVSAWANAGSRDIEDFPPAPAQLAALAALVTEGKLPLHVAREELFPLLISNPATPPLALAETYRLLQATDSGALQDAMREVMAQHPEEVRRFRQGKKQLEGFFVGQLMRRLQGKADPQAVNRVVRELLEATQDNP